jgi:hypothetical protein
MRHPAHCQRSGRRSTDHGIPGWLCIHYPRCTSKRRLSARLPGSHVGLCCRRPWVRNHPWSPHVTDSGSLQVSPTIDGASVTPGRRWPPEFPRRSQRLPSCLGQRSRLRCAALSEPTVGVLPCDQREFDSLDGKLTLCLGRATATPPQHGKGSAVGHVVQPTEYSVPCACLSGNTTQAARQYRLSQGPMGRRLARLPRCARNGEADRPIVNRLPASPRCRLNDRRSQPLPAKPAHSPPPLIAEHAPCAVQARHGS